jgi:hypothetical protein
LTEGITIYPNPWNGGSDPSVRVTLQHLSDLKIRMFTTAYRKVWEGDFSQVPVGTENFEIGLRDKKGTSLANGVYYIVVDTFKRRFISKLLLVH